jgi:hypothetical protein
MTTEYGTYLPFQNFVFDPVSIVSIEPIPTGDSTHIRVTFSRMVENNVDLNDVINYQITPPLVVISVTPEPGVYRPIYVDLEVSAMTDGVTYTINIDTVV